MDLARSFIFGLTLGISIGPIAILIMNHGISYGKKTSLMSACGAAAADFTYALAGFSFGYALISLLENNSAVFTAASSVVLIIFGIYMLVQAVKKMRQPAGIIVPQKPQNTFISTYLLTIVNPLTILLFAGFAGNMHTVSPAAVIGNAMALCAGSLLVNVLIALTASYLRHFIGGTPVVMVLNMISGLIVFLFGLVHFL